MLKSQEIEIDGEKFTLREPRIRDHLLAAKRLVTDGPDAYAMAMLAGMLLDPTGREVGAEFIADLPLRHFNELAKAMEEFNPSPLPSKTELSSA